MADIEFSEEQGLLALSAGDFLARHSGFDAVRAQIETDTGYDRARFEELAQLGWLGAALPESHGGSGMPVGALVSLAEPMGQNLFSSPWLATTLAGQLVARAGSEAQRARWLPGIAGGSCVASVALAEHGGSWDFTQPSLRAVRQAGGYRLTGDKTLVLDAAVADLLLVSASLDGAPAVFAVEREALGEGALRRQVVIDETRRAFHLHLDDTAVATDARLGGSDGADDAGDALRHVYRVGALLVAAEMTGGTEGVMALTLDYLRTRTQFGKPIGSYQALKHPMVDILIAQEQARSLLYHAATAFDADDQESADIAIHMAKAAATDCFTHAADRAIQFHGGIGFTYECHAQLFFRRAQWAAASFGDAAHHRRRLQPLLLDTARQSEAIAM